MAEIDADIGVPLCVDLDGTLVACDTLHHSIAMLLRRRPWACGTLPLHVLRGRAAFKRTVADQFVPDPARLPYRGNVVGFLRDERKRGRTLLLVTAADRLIADPVANHLGLFDEVIASDGRSNVKGAAKALAIRRHLAHAPFDYMGDSVADLPVFAAARQAILVCPSPRLAARARACSHVVYTFQEPARRGGHPAGAGAVCDGI